jgi:signal transduction histidine kinase
MMMLLAGTVLALFLNWPWRASMRTGDRGQPQFAQLAIEDEGPGIPEDKAARVFDRFYRVDEGRARDAGGAGLGLAIAKWAVEVHGGSINLAPAQLRGSIFTIQFPIAPFTPAVFPSAMHLKGKSNAV